MGNTEKLENISTIFKGGSILFLGNVLSKGPALLFLIVATRILGVDGFGTLALALSIYAVSQNIALLGLSNTIQRFISGNNEQVRAYYGAVILIGLLGTIFFSGVLFFSGAFIANALFKNKALAEILPWFGPILLITVPVQLLSAVLRAQGNMKQAAALNVINSAGRLFFVCILAFLGSLGGVIAAVGLASIVQLFFAILFIIRVKLRPDLKTGCRLIPKVFNYSLPLLVAGFGYFQVQQTGRLMLGYYGYTAGVGQYTAVSNIIQTAGLFHGSVISAFMPPIARAYEAKEFCELKKNYHITRKMLASVSGIVVILVVVLGSYVLNLFGPDFTSRNGYLVMILLGASSFVSSWFGPTGALLQMTDGNKLEFLNTILLMLLNVILNLILIPHMGVIGAAGAILLSNIMTNILQSVQIYLRIGITYLHFDMVIWFISVITCLYLLGTGLWWGKVISLFVAGMGIIYILIKLNSVRKHL
ncbi:Membrane protein involved in the export of O-antigen and teichoic acid [Desulfotomaculum arcticum]|uniref:Membrane protein involved in the export of O-antigen and teichoic acid n=1 Tax=Desulfotruncus arcticus DSM 17038 TaxID=1121424 RepID=A0A1I2VKC8_9FIRM|nr:oligosaccharide flippase family protein [Desulfotruncus arcticus]SFG89795.1 Membrane protein involved in the export of O-antigen and teichoic acid [Desulfotomaculum arcticum] [Desulfotruncus arcticus DSM 17038]